MDEEAHLNRAMDITVILLVIKATLSALEAQIGEVGVDVTLLR